MTPDPELIVQVLRRAPMRVATEAALQASIGEALDNAGFAFEAEVRLSTTDRIDFLAGSVGIEAKARYDKRAIYRQLERYAAHDRISALVLVTGTAMGLPPTIGGKPLFYVSLGRAAL